MLMIAAFILNAILCAAFATRCDTFIIANAIIVAAILVRPQRLVKPTNSRHRQGYK